MHSNNTKEYLSHQFQAFLASYGVLCQISCAYTPQQNGAIERKNHNLIETTSTFLLHGLFPFLFWGDIILAACYLINHMPSSIWETILPTVCYLLIHRCILPSCMSLGPHVFSITLHLVLTSFPPRPSNVFSLST